MEAIESMTVDEAAELSEHKVRQHSRVFAAERPRPAQLLVSVHFNAKLNDSFVGHAEKAVSVLSDSSADTESLLEALEGIQSMCDNLDLAQVLSKIGGMTRLIGLLRHDNGRIRTLAAETLAVTVQNDKVTQDSAAASGALAAACDLVSRSTAAASAAMGAASASEGASEDVHEELSKALLAVSSLIRGHDDMTAAFVDGSFASPPAPMMLLGDAPTALGAPAPAPAARAAEPAPPAASAAAPTAAVGLGLPCGPELLSNAMAASTSDKVLVRGLFLIRYLLESGSRVAAASAAHFAAHAPAGGHGLLRLCAGLITPLNASEDAPAYLLQRALEAASKVCRVALEAKLEAARGSIPSDGEAAATAGPGEAAQLPTDDQAGIEAVRLAAVTVTEAMTAQAGRAEELADEIDVASSLIKACDALLKMT